MRRRLVFEGEKQASSVKGQTSGVRQSDKMFEGERPAQGEVERE